MSISAYVKRDRKRRGLGVLHNYSDIGIVPHMESILEERSVGEAARALGVSDRRVRAMIRDGVLAGRRSGGRWLIRRDDVEERLRPRGPPGGPLGPRNGWALLMELSCVGLAPLPGWDR